MNKKTLNKLYRDCRNNYLIKLISSLLFILFILSISVPNRISAKVRNSSAIINNFNIDIQIGDDIIKTNDNVIQSGDNIIQTGNNVIQTGDNVIQTGDNDIPDIIEAVDEVIIPIPELTLSQTSKGILITVEPMTDVDGYILYVSTDAETFTRVKVISDSYTYIYKKAELHTPYYFRSRAFLLEGDDRNYGMYSDNVSITLKKPLSATMEDMHSIDFVSDSVTGLSKKELSLTKIAARLSSYGNFIGNGGMPYDDYVAAMSVMWEDCTDYKNEFQEVNVDITESYNYKELVKIMKKLSRYDGVYLYKIGSSYNGRDMYAIEVDIPSQKDKKTVALTGNVHSRETAGSIYIIKELADLLQADTKESRQVLSSVRFLAIPCCNPDGREGVAFNTKLFTYSNGQLWKAAANGTDLNRNFPGVSCGQILYGNPKSKYISTSPSKIYYPGDHLGSNPETWAIMKFVYYCVAIAKAPILIDYHQQGRIAYAGKPWQTSAQENRCVKLAKYILNACNKGNGTRYLYIKEDSEYGLNGVGSTLTDYACSIATGAKYSIAYGFYVYTDDEKEYPLISIGDLDDTEFTIEEVNSQFSTMTFEIGSGASYLGYSSSTRSNLNKEYYKYHYDRVLYNVADYLQE